MNNKLYRRATSAAVALGFLAMGASSAIAAGNTVDAHTIDADQNGQASITVVKYKQSATNGQTEGTGLDTPAPDGETLKGAKFKVVPVQSINGTELPAAADWAKNSTWATLAGLVDGDGQPKGEVVLNEGAASEVKTTPENGQVVFDSLPFGLYKVVETEAPSGATPAAPFYVTVPLATKANPSLWSYNPVVYPKNTVNTIEKTVNDTATYGIDSPIQYTIKTSLSKPGGEATTKYVVTDKLHAKVAFQSATVAFEKNDSITLESGTDYDLTPAAATDDGGQTVTLTFKDTGFAKLAQAYEADMSDHVVLVINGKIIKNAGEGGDNIKVPNRAYFIPDNNPIWNEEHDGGDKPGIPSKEVETRFAKLNLHKVAAESESTTLDGAKFKIFKNREDAVADRDPIQFLDADGNAVTETETKNGGLAEFNSIRVSDFENSVTSDPGRSYFLVETQAPNGYGKLAEPVEVKLASSSTDGNNTFEVDTTIKNTKQNTGLKLAKTGANGPLFIAGAGATILLGTGAVVLGANRSRKRKEA